MTTAVLALAITSVTNQDGVIPNGGITKKNRFVVRGKATAGASVQLNDGVNVIETNYANHNGDYTSKELTRPVGERHLLLLSNGLVSAPYTFTILPPT